MSTIGTTDISFKALYSGWKVIGYNQMGSPDTTDGSGEPLNIKLGSFRGAKIMNNPVQQLKRGSLSNSQYLGYITLTQGHLSIATYFKGYSFQAGTSPVAPNGK